MNKSKIIEEISKFQPELSAQDAKRAVNIILECMAGGLEKGNRIEIRGFGSFSIHYHPPRVSRNPKTGETFFLGSKYVPHFRPSRQLLEPDKKSSQA